MTGGPVVFSGLTLVGSSGFIRNPSSGQHPCTSDSMPCHSEGKVSALSEFAAPARSIALVHEWYGATGGSEKVFESIGEIFPAADRYVLWKDRGARPGAHLQESWLARTPLRRSKALALPTMMLAWRTLTRNRYDVVISSSHAFAHTVKLGEPGRTKHLSYIHSPARYVWSPQLDGRGTHPALVPMRAALKRADVRMSRHVDSYAANSREVQGRIRRFWGRDAYVIHPPVDIDYFTAAPAAQREQNRDYLLGVGRWIGYKNFDVMIAIADAAGVPLVVAGSGPDEDRLRAQAARCGARVVFEVSPGRDRLRELYWGARALLFPTHEDFGIVPVEAQACGTPVLGLARGGLLETVDDSRTGYLIDSFRPEEYAALVPRLDHLDRNIIQTNATRFSADVFQKRVADWVQQEAG
jgi:glycosyltransferase involved in cell wall biosynthesis